MTGTPTECVPRVLTMPRSRNIIAEEHVAQINQGALAPPAGWSSRALYTGDAGASHWLAVAGESGYPLRDPQRFHLRDNRLAALTGRSFATWVSLGPGDGRTDAEFIKFLHEAAQPPVWLERRLTYIPVEISRPLLEIAMANLQLYADVPVGILCDFEEQQDFLARSIGPHVTRPVLFALFGGTVGNLDGDEDAFFAGIRRMMQPGDAFLLDVPLAAPSWTAESEPRLKAGGYTPAFRRFLGAGLSQPTGCGSTTVPPTAPTQSAAFDNGVVFSLRHDVRTGAEVIAASDPRTGRTVLNRRYRWQQLLRWFADHGFTVAFARSSVVSDQEKFGMGVTLLTIS